ncbi:MAG: 30S ribosomal protein S6 [Clostridia bacterium]|nr:30S ribosomal protein S6 [Clostridia bacterium]
MQSYEAVVILTGKTSEEEAQEAANKIKKLISSNGEVVSVDDWKTRKLAYEIKHEKEGHYFLYTFNAAPTFISEFERVLRINTQVLKHMVIKK